MLSVCITNWKTTRWSSRRSSRRSRDVSRLESVSALFEFTTGRSSTVADSHWNWAGLHGLQNKRQPRPMRQILLETDMIWHVYTKYNIYIYISIYLSLSLSKYCKVDERGKSICRTRFKIFDDFWLSSQWMPVNLDSIRGSCLATALTIQYSLRIVGSDPPLSTATPALLCRPMRQTCDMNVQYF